VYGVGGFCGYIYWSSTEQSAAEAVEAQFIDPYIIVCLVKNSPQYVRAVRRF